MRFFKSIKIKIAFSMSFSMAFCMLIMGVISSVSNYQSTLSTLEHTLTESARIASERVEQELDKYMKIAYSAGCNPVLSSAETPMEVKQAVLEATAKSNGLEIPNILDADGISLFEGGDYSDREYFKTAMQGESCISTPVVSKINGSLIMVVAAPIWEGGVPNSNLVGVVMFVPPETFLNDIVSNLKMTDNGYAYMLDKNGNTIAHKSLDSVKNAENSQNDAKSDPELKEVAELERQMCEGKNGFGQYSYNGISKFLAFAPVNGTDGWSLAVTVPVADIMGSTNRSILITIIVLIISVAATIPCAMLLAKQVADPIEICSKRMKALADGDLHSPVPPAKTKDETAVLLDSVSVLTNGMNELIGDIDYILSSMAQGNFTTKSRCENRYVGDFSGLLNSVRNVRGQLAETMREIDMAAMQVASGADEVSGGAQALAQGSTEQASSIQELAATINVVADKIRTNAEHAEEANSKSKISGDEMQDVSVMVKELVEAMEEIKSSSDETSKIIKTIEDIAFQTNILALNAAVEASRAGEAGKGFAVVADEVRNLAGKSAEAANNTTALIENTVQAIEKGNRFVGDVADRVVSVSEVSKEVAEISALISRDSAEAAESVSQITLGVDQISSVVQTNSATAEESAAASEELSRQADVLKKQVERFTL